ncbi:MAG: hypothetical protein ACM3WV_02235 [Bacillota bacterium]
MPAKNPRIRAPGILALVYTAVKVLFFSCSGRRIFRIPSLIYAETLSGHTAAGSLMVRLNFGNHGAGKRKKGGKTKY